MRNPHAVFAAPFFIEPIDLDKVNLVSEKYEQSYLSGIETTMGSDKFTDESYEYVKSLISFLDDDIEKASKHIKQAIKIDRDEKRYRELHHRIRSKILKRMANDD